MFHIKTKARYLTHGFKTKAQLFSVLPPLALGCGAVFLFPAALCAVYGAKTVFAGSPVYGLLQRYPWTGRAMTAALFTAAGLCAVAYFSLRFTLKALFYYRTDKNQIRPAHFLSFKAGVKALACGATLFCLKTGTVLLLLTPALGTLLLTAALLFLGALTKPLLFLGAGTALVQIAAALATGYVLNRRYCLTSYLLYLNPLMRVKEAVSSGVLLMRGKLLFSAACGLAALPWRALCLFSVTRPFAYSYTRLMDAVMCETLFAEDKYRPGVPTVCFIINKNSRFSVEN